MLALARAVAQLPVVVVATLRPYPRNRELDAAVDDLVSRGAVRLVLHPLDEREVGALADVPKGARPGSRSAGRLASAGATHCW